MHHATEIGMMIKNGEHVAAAHKLVAMLEANGGNIMHVALEAKVDRSTLKRWIQRLALAGYPIGDKLAKLRDEAGDTRTMSAVEAAARADQNREQCEHARVLLWLRNPAVQEAVAIKAKTTDTMVAKVAAGGRVSAELKERVLRAARRSLVSQRRDWRDARLRRASAKR